MKVCVSSIDLRGAVEKARRVVPSRTALPILGFFRLEAGPGGVLQISSYDMEAGIEVEIPAIVETEGACTVPARALCALAKALPGTDVWLESNGEAFPASATILRAGDLVYRLLNLPAEEFPRIPSAEDGAATFRIAGDEMRSIIRQVALFAARGEERLSLAGVLIEAEGETARFVATDGHRLGVGTGCISGLAEPIRAVVPAHVMRMVTSLLGDGADPVTVDVGGHVRFSRPHLSISSRLIESEYPNYRRVIREEHSREWVIPWLELRRAVERAEIVAKSDGHRLVFGHAGGDQITIAADSGGFGSAFEVVPGCTCTGGPLQIGFNGSYVRGILSAIGSVEAVRIELGEPLSGAVWRAVGREDGFFAMIMPIRV